MRETVGDEKVLKTSRDPGLGGLREINPDWNLEDIASTSHFFLDRLQFRVETELSQQHREGANGDPGDREITFLAAQRVAADCRDEWATFLELGKDYGRWLRPTGVDGRRSLEEVAAHTDLILRAHEVQPIIWRQETTLMYYNHLIEETLS